MQRRKFLTASTTAAALALPIAAVAAKSLPMVPGTDDLRLSLLSSDDGSCFAAGQACNAASGPVRVRVSSVSAPRGTSAGFRIWFAGDEGQHAFEAASVSRSGSSSPLKFHADARHLVSADVTFRSADNAAEQCAQCVTSGQGLGHLRPGQHWLVLHSIADEVTDPEHGRVLARVRLDVTAA